MKLLTKTIRSYLIYSFVVLLVTIPVFYLVVQYVLMDSVDKSLRLHLADLRGSLSTVHSKEELLLWARLDKDIRLTPASRDCRDSLYTNFLVRDTSDPDPNPYRQLSSCISIAGERYQVVISTSMVESEDLLGSIVVVVALLLILLLAGMVWINRRVSKRLWTPFYDSIREMQGYELTKQPPALNTDTGTQEFNDLNKSLGNLLRRMEDSFIAQKEFTENAAHEVQTPLAIFQGQLELLMQTKPLTEEQAMLLASMQETNQRISRLNRSLLLLTKIENDEYERNEAVDVAQMLKQFTASYLFQAEKKNLRFVETYDDPLHIKANPALLEILISNLVSNAVRYSQPGGEIRISTRDGKLMIRNGGDSASLDTENLFGRFRKQSANQEGFGLGLAIVSRICKMHGYRITYDFSDHHHLFSIHFLPSHEI